MMSADIIDMNKKTIKRGKKKLSTEKQCELIYDRLLDLSEELQDTVTIPNMVISLQQFVCEPMILHLVMLLHLICY